MRYELPRVEYEEVKILPSTIKEIMDKYNPEEEWGGFLVKKENEDFLQLYVPKQENSFEAVRLKNNEEITSYVSFHSHSVIEEHKNHLPSAYDVFVFPSYQIICVEKELYCYRINFKTLKKFLKKHFKSKEKDVYIIDRALPSIDIAKLIELEFVIMKDNLPTKPIVLRKAIPITLEIKKEE